MKPSDTTAMAREEYAAAVATVLDLTVPQIKDRMDKELADLRVRNDSPSDLRWYASIEKGQPDYGIYDDPDYMLYLWPGTVLYARPTVKWTAREVPASAVRTVVDLGCGIGYSTGLLASLYPNASVYGTQVEGVQAQVGRYLGKHNCFSIVPDAAAVPSHPRQTLAVASEYFEHFYRPVEHLEQVLAGITPRWFAIANAFSAHSAGHFPVYAYRQTRMTPRSIARKFNDTMREHGYLRYKSAFNDRPILWRKAST